MSYFKKPGKKKRKRYETERTREEVSKDLRISLGMLDFVVEKGLFIRPRIIEEIVDFGDIALFNLSDWEPSEYAPSFDGECYTIKDVLNAIGYETGIQISEEELCNLIRESGFPGPDGTAKCNGKFEVLFERCRIDRELEDDEIVSAIYHYKS